MENYKSLWLSIKVARLNAGFTQKEFAEYLNTSTKTIYEYEKGKYKPSLERLHQISNICCTTVNELLFLATLPPEFYPMWAVELCRKEILEWLQERNITGSNYKRISSKSTT